MTSPSALPFSPPAPRAEARRCAALRADAHGESPRREDEFLERRYADYYIAAYQLLRHFSRAGYTRTMEYAKAECHCLFAGAARAQSVRRMICRSCVSEPEEVMGRMRCRDQTRAYMRKSRREGRRRRVRARPGGGRLGDGRKRPSFAHTIFARLMIVGAPPARLAELECHADGDASRGDRAQLRTVSRSTMRAGYRCAHGAD